MKTHVSITEILDIVRRRRKFFIVPFLVITLISAMGSFILPKKYESYITILLKKEQTLNPLLDFQKAVMAVALSDNQLASFNEILYSRTTIETLLVSLGQKPEEVPGESTEQKWNDLIEATRKKITTDLRGNDSFRITFTDSDPYACQKAAEVLSTVYIQTSLKADRQQAEETVKFLESKVRELKEQYDEQQQQYLRTRHRGLEVQPFTETGLQNIMEKVQGDLNEKQRILAQQEHALSLLKMFQENLDNPGIVSQIGALDPQGGAILYVDTLKAVSLRYGQLLNRYMPAYPQVQATRRELADLLDKSAEALQAKVEVTKGEVSGLLNLREKTQRDISSSIEVSVTGSEKGTEFIRVKENYDGTRQKLDQARIAKELVDRGASKYVILDPAQLPVSPTKPKKSLIIGGGAGLGFLVGLIAMFVVEFYDPTIRRKTDIEVFNKPVIGYLP